jgi:hypothetical protein
MRLTEFRNTIDQSRRLIAAGHVMDAKVVYSWPGPDRLVVVGTAFLKAFITWEISKRKHSFNTLWERLRQLET